MFSHAFYFLLLLLAPLNFQIDAALSLSSSEDTETTETRNQAKVDKMLRQKYEASSWKHPGEKKLGELYQFEYFH